MEFSDWDRDGDGVITRSEFFAANSHDLNVCRLFDQLCLAWAEAEPATGMAALTVPVSRDAHQSVRRVSFVHYFVLGVIGRLCFVFLDKKRLFRARASKAVSLQPYTRSTGFCTRTSKP